MKSADSSTCREAIQCEESMGKAVIKKQQDARIRHLEKEIQIFTENIDKLKKSK
jgi:hypothetical protein